MNKTLKLLLALCCCCILFPAASQAQCGPNGCGNQGGFNNLPPHWILVDEPGGTGHIPPDDDGNDPQCPVGGAPFCINGGLHCCGPDLIADEFTAPSGNPACACTVPPSPPTCSGTGSAGEGTCSANAAGEVANCCSEGYEPRVVDYGAGGVGCSCWPSDSRPPVDPPVVNEPPVWSPPPWNTGGCSGGNCPWRR